MRQELADLLQLFNATHASIEKMVEDLSAQEWVTKPRPDFNAIAAVLQHIAMVETRFLTILDGQTPEPATVNPFTSEHWDVPTIRATYQALPAFASEVLHRLDPDTLEQHAVKLGIGELNRRQLLAYTIAHTTHHRGQIPLIKTLLRTP